MTSFAHVLAEQWTMSSKKVKTEMFAEWNPLFHVEYAGPHFRKIWKPK